MQEAEARSPASCHRGKSLHHDPGFTLRGCRISHVGSGYQGCHLPGTVMDATHFHLVISHAPLFGVLFGALLLAYVVARRSDEAARLGLGLVVIAGLLAVPTFISGDEAEDRVENIVGVSDVQIEAHEEAGKLAGYGIAGLGLLALGGLLAFRRRPIPRPVVLGALVLTLAATAGVGYTANLGGQIRHTEIRDGATSLTSTDPERPREDRGDDH